MIIGETLLSENSTDGDTYVLSTFGVYLQTRHAELYTFLKDHSTEAARFRGSIGDGDVVVVRIERGE